MAEQDLNYAVNGQVPPELQDAVKPPANPEELQQRVSGWQMVQQKLMSDPNLSMALIRMGTRMMQPRQWGQTGMGQIGAAVEHGLNSYQMGQGYAQEQGLKEREMRAKEQQVASTTNLQGAQTGHVQAQTDTMQQELPFRLQKIASETKLTDVNADYHGALARMSDLEREIKQKYGASEAEAKINDLRASEVYKTAMAKYHDVHGQVLQDSLTQGKGWQAGQTKVDNERGVIITDMSNRTTGERQTVQSFIPVPYNDAVARAKADVKSALAMGGSSWFGVGKDQLDSVSRLVGQTVKNEQEAVRILADRYAAGRTVVQTYDPRGGFSNRELKPGETPTGPRAPVTETAPNSAAGLARAQELQASGQPFTVSVPSEARPPGAPIPTSAVVPSALPTSADLTRAGLWSPGESKTISSPSGQRFQVTPQGVVSPLAVSSSPATTPPATTVPAASPAPTGAPAMNVDALVRQGGVSGLLDAVRARYPGPRSGRGGSVATDSPEVARLKGLTGQALIDEAKRLLGA